MTNENVEKLGTAIAQALIRIGREAGGPQWVTEDHADHAVGELARCITLQNIYLEREEYEKCEIMKIEIKRLQDLLNLDSNDEENDEI